MSSHTKNVVFATSRITFLWCMFIGSTYKYTKLRIEVMRIRLNNLVYRHCWCIAAAQKTPMDRFVELSIGVCHYRSLQPHTQKESKKLHMLKYVGVGRLAAKWGNSHSTTLEAFNVHITIGSHCAAQCSNVIKLPVSLVTWSKQNLFQKTNCTDIGT